MFSHVWEGCSCFIWFTWWTGYQQASYNLFACFLTRQSSFRFANSLHESTSVRQLFSCSSVSVAKNTYKIKTKQKIHICQNVALNFKPTAALRGKPTETFMWARSRSWVSFGLDLVVCGPVCLGVYKRIVGQWMDNHLFENHELIQEVNALAGEEFPDGLVSLSTLRVRGHAHLLILEELSQREVLHKQTEQPS